MLGRVGRQSRNQAEQTGPEAGVGSQRPIPAKIGETNHVRYVNRLKRSRRQYEAYISADQEDLRALT